MVERECQKCGRTKPITEFSRCRKIESGFLWKCKECEMRDISAYIRATNPNEFGKRGSSGMDWMVG